MDRYRELKVLGKGSFGRAVLAQEKNTGEKYVMKIIHTAPLRPRERDEALMEAKILSKLQHPYIVGYHESFADTRYLYIVMEYADAGDLTGLINRQKQRRELFTEDQIWDWFVQVCLALKHVHDRKILHRDLKTQNIFLCTDPRDRNRKNVKLGDFGIAKILQSTLECAKTAIGTPYYLSPELCEDKPYNNKSDIWSLGCVLYELCTLQHAFEAANMKGLVVKILRGQYRPISQVYSGNLRELIDRMLQKDPTRRPSVNQILKLPFLQERIKRLLPEEYWHEEFSHTIIHGRGNALVGFGAGRIGVPGKPVSAAPQQGEQRPAQIPAAQPATRYPNPTYQPSVAPSVAQQQQRQISAAEAAAAAIRNGQKPTVPSNIKQPGAPAGLSPPKPSYDDIVRQERARIEEQRRRSQEEQRRAQEKVRQDYMQRQQQQQQQQQQQAFQNNPFARKPSAPPAQPAVPHVPSANTLDARFADLQDFVNKPPSAAPRYNPQAPAIPMAGGAGQPPSQPYRDNVARRNAEEQRRHQQAVKRQLAPAPLKEQAKDARERELQEMHERVQRQKEEQERRIREAKEKQRAEWEKRNRDYERQMEEKRRAAQMAEEREKALAARERDRLFRQRQQSEGAPANRGMESLLPQAGVVEQLKPDDEKARKLEEQRTAMRRMIAEKRREAQAAINGESQQAAEVGHHGPRRLADVPSSVSAMAAVNASPRPTSAAEVAAAMVSPQRGLPVAAPAPVPLQAPVSGQGQNELACLDEEDSEEGFEDPHFCIGASSAGGEPDQPGAKQPTAIEMAAKMLRGGTTEDSISLRMERLRMLLENELGFDRFFEVYSHIRKQTDDGDDELDNGKIERLLGAGNMGYMNTIVNLIYCEDRFNTNR